MHSTAIDRRTFLALAGASLLPVRLASADEQALFLGARLNGDKFEAAVVDEAGTDRLVLPLEARGHSFAIDLPRGRAVAFARSPGRFAVAFDVAGRAEPVAIAAAPGRHFFGHGIFTPDGRLMLATESDYEGERGVTGIYDATAGFRRVGELDTAGIGPHEVLLMPDGRTACVANGGILTHPDYDRLKLNIDTMKPSIAYLDIATGEVVEQVELAPELHKLSIRHMVLDATGAVWFGCQYEGEPADRPPLVGRHQRGRAPELFTGGAGTLRGLDNYVGSMAIDRAGEVIATSSPRGGIVAFWDAATGRHLGERSLADVCGVAPLAKGHVLATSGRGDMADMTPDRQSPLSGPAGVQWDNHLRRL